MMYIESNIISNLIKTIIDFCLYFLYFISSIELSDEIKLFVLIFRQFDISKFHKLLYYFSNELNLTIYRNINNYFYFDLDAKVSLNQIVCSFFQSMSLPRGNSANQQTFSRIDQEHLRFVYSQQQQQDERPLHLLTANSYSEDTLQNNSLSLACGTFSNKRRRQDALKSDTIYPESAEPLLKVSRR